jgi:hypothetical protein
MFLTQSTRNRFERIGATAIDEDGRPCLRQSFSHGKPEAARAAGDERNSPIATRKIAHRAMKCEVLGQRHARSLQASQRDQNQNRVNLAISGTSAGRPVIPRNSPSKQTVRIGSLVPRPAMAPFRVLAKVM